MTVERIWTLMSRKLLNEATPAELIELDELIKTHPDAAIITHTVQQLWNIPNENEDDFLEATYHLHKQRLKDRSFDLELMDTEKGFLNLQQPKRYKRSLILGISMVLFIFATSIFVFFYKDNPPHLAVKNKIIQSEVSTKSGSRSKVQLPDGSLVWLNSSSKLTYNNDHFGEAIREVTLSGEAFFDVVKNPLKPFIIHTNKMDIKVLGTAFNVKCYAGDKNSETSLIRGSIEVTLKDRQEKIMMKPNEKLVVNSEDSKIGKAVLPIDKHEKVVTIKSQPIIELSHLTLFPSDNSVVETAWVDNRLVFNNESLEDIAIKMERWYGVSIVITNEKLKKVLLTGILEKETIYQALNAMQLTTPFTYKVDKGIITISK
ncbi:FecR family protein [Parasediminibacterium paludis]|uniref:FecR family protein n=1 Tax=Parasediminibacterium paludis TaxID=908966 RepID=A0ABV8PV33_9BACT